MVHEFCTRLLNGSATAALLAVGIAVGLPSSAIAANIQLKVTAKSAAKAIGAVPRARPRTKPIFLHQPALVGDVVANQERAKIFALQVQQEKLNEQGAVAIGQAGVRRGIRLAQEATLVNRALINSAVRRGETVPTAVAPASEAAAPAAAPAITPEAVTPETIIPVDAPLEVVQRLADIRSELTPEARKAASAWWAANPDLARSIRVSAAPAAPAEAAVVNASDLTIDPALAKAAPADSASTPAYRHVRAQPGVNSTISNGPQEEGESNGDYITRINRYYDVNYQYRQKLLADAQAGDEAAKKQIERDRIADMPRNEAAVTQALSHIGVIKDTIQQIMNVLAGDVMTEFDMSPESLEAALANSENLRSDGTGALAPILDMFGGTDYHRVAALVEVLKGNTIEGVAKMYGLSNIWGIKMYGLSNIWGTINPRNSGLFIRSMLRQYKKAVALEKDIKRAFYRDHHKSLVLVEDWKEKGFPWPPIHKQLQGNEGLYD